MYKNWINLNFLYGSYFDSNRNRHSNFQMLLLLRVILPFAMIYVEMQFAKWGFRLTIQSYWNHRPWVCLFRISMVSYRRYTNERQKLYWLGKKKLLMGLVTKLFQSYFRKRSGSFRNISSGAAQNVKAIDYVLLDRRKSNKLHIFQRYPHEIFEG